MKQMILVTFVLLAGAFWILSGGADFEPQNRPPRDAIIVTATPADIDPTPEPAEPAAVREQPSPGASALTERLPEISPPAPPPTPLVTEPQPVIEAPNTAEQIAQSAALEAAVAAALNSEVQAPDAVTDLREIAAEGVNMRDGPSTEFAVLRTLTGGTGVEVIEERDDGRGPWARVIVSETGEEGWVASRLLSQP